MNRAILLAMLLTGILFPRASVEAQENSTPGLCAESKSVFPGKPNSAGPSGADCLSEEMVGRIELEIQRVFQLYVAGYLRPHGLEESFRPGDPYGYLNPQSNLHMISPELIASLKPELAKLDEQFELARQNGEDPGEDLRLKLIMYTIALEQIETRNVVGIISPTTHPAEYYLAEETDAEPDIMSELRLRFDLNRAMIQMSRPKTLWGQAHPELSKAPETIDRIRKRIQATKRRRGTEYTLELTIAESDWCALERRLSEIHLSGPDRWN